MKIRIAIIFFLATSAIPVVSFSQQAYLHYQDGLVSVNCIDASLEEIFLQLKIQADIELILEDSVKSKKLNANFTKELLQLAVQRLLDSTDVNYVIMMDSTNWSLVSKVFVGAGGGHASKGGVLPPRATVQPLSTAEDNYDYSDNMIDTKEANAVEFANRKQDPSAPELEMPPNSSVSRANEPVYLPAPPSYPRSPFTPGPGASPFGALTPFNPEGADLTTLPDNSNPNPVPPEIQRQKEKK